MYSSLFIFSIIWLYDSLKKKELFVGMVLIYLFNNRGKDCLNFFPHVF